MEISRPLDSPGTAGATALDSIAVVSIHCGCSVVVPPLFATVVVANFTPPDTAKDWFTWGHSTGRGSNVNVVFVVSDEEDDSKAEKKAEVLEAEGQRPGVEPGQQACGSSCIGPVRYMAWR